MPSNSRYETACRRCGRALRHPVSQKNGYGPVCLEKERQEAVAKQAARRRDEVAAREVAAPLRHADC